MSRAGLSLASLPATIVLVGALVRASHTLASDFPLNDGGLFYVMVGELRGTGFALPVMTAYNDAGLPFVYPPLALYLAGLLAAVGPWSLLDLLRWLPLLFSVLTVAAFWLLARALLPTRVGALLAAAAFALLPVSFQWLIMGGGLTRAPGFLLALLALWQLQQLYTRPGRGTGLLATLFAAATVLTHPAMAWFLAYSSVVLFLAHGPRRDALRRAGLVAAGAALVTAPWWAEVLARHGLAPLLAASSTGLYPLTLVRLLTLAITNEPYFPVLGALAALGTLACLQERRVWLPAWLLVMVALDARSLVIGVSVPLALLAGVGASDVLLRWLLRDVGPPSEDGAAADTARRDSARVPWLAWAAGGFIGCLATLGAIADPAGALVGLTADQRAALQWVAASSAASSRYLVITGSSFPSRDRVSEWFPALTGRASVTTMQGSEWEPGGAFGRQLERDLGVQPCALRGAACVEAWARESGVRFDHVYLPKGPTGASADSPLVQDCCWALRTSLAASPRYETEYDGPGATVFRRLEP